MLNQNADGDLNLEEAIRDAFKGRKHGSDFNYPHIEQVDSCSGHDKERTFLSMLNDCALEPVLEPIKSEATIALILCSIEVLV